MLPLLFSCVTLLASVLIPAESKEILVLLPIPGYSHTMPFMPIFKELGRRGHNLTMVTPFPQEPTPAGFHQLTVPLTLEEFTDKMWVAIGRKPSTKESLRFKSQIMMQLLFVLPFCKIITPLLNERLKPLLPPPGTHYDLVITEPFFCTENIVGAGHVYGAPVVATLPMLPTPMSGRPMGIPDSDAIIPNFRVPFSNKMNFFERTYNLIINTAELIVNQFFHLPLMDTLTRELYNETTREELPYLGDLLGNISLLLTSTHFSLSYPRPYLRNVVEVGGANLEEPKPLPQELEKWMNESKEGVILFSWGSHYTPVDANKIEVSLMKTFSQLKQRVLIKWVNETIPGKPKNVRVQKWVPQPSILQHRNTVAFISHCGLSSIYEAAYHGVPVVATPLFGDQLFNAKVLEEVGMAVQVEADKIEDDSELLTSAIKTVLSNPSFKKNALKRRELLLDRPMKPLEEAVYWVEYVMRHGGGQHLRPPALPWYSLVALDVIIFLAALASLPLWFLYFLCRRCRRSSSPPPSKPQLSKGKKNK